MVEKCCSHWMRVGYIWRRKYEVYICPKCKNVQFSPGVNKFMKFILTRFSRHIHLYDDRQVRLYLDGERPEIVADTTGEIIRERERGFEGLCEQFPELKI